MTTLKNKISFIAILLLGTFMSLNVFAGDPPPIGGDPTTDPGSTPIGGSAPIDGGYLVLIVLVLLYATLRYFYRKRIIDNI